MADPSPPESRWRPALPPKSAAVLMVAEEILKQKRGDQGRETLSDSEIYDDIVTLRNTDDDIYDDIVVEVMRKQHLSANTMEATPQSKPQLAPKPLCLQSFLSAKRHTAITSYEDIYDDIVVQKMREKLESASIHQLTNRAKKPCPAPKSSGLYKHPLVKELMQEAKRKRAMTGDSQQHSSDVDLEDIYDDIISTFACESQKTKQKQDQAPDNTTGQSHLDTNQSPNQINTSQAVTTEIPLPGSHRAADGLSAAGSESVYVNTANLQSQLYDNECIIKGRVIQFKESGDTSSKLHMADPTAQSSTVSRPRPQKKSLPRQTSAPTSKLQSIGKSQTLPRELQLSKTSPQFQHSSTPEAEKRSMNDPLPTVTAAPNPEAHSVNLEITAWDSEEEEEAYEYLPLYEDLEKFQDEDGSYEEASTVVVKALNLPHAMRSRATRITIGQKKHMQKCLKKSMRKRSQTTPSGFSTSKPSAQQLREYRNKHEETPAQDAAVSSEEDPSDETIPFGKSRLVFEMLLDASGIERIADCSQDSNDSESQKVAPKTDQEVESQRSPEQYKEFFSPTELDKLQEDPEIKRYKDAGIISLRSKSDIAAEIEEITANVSTVPPPLPGQRRQRTSVITRHEKTKHKRFLLQRHKSLREDIPQQPSQPSVKKESQRRVSVPAVAVTKAQEPLQTGRESAAAKEQLVPAVPHLPTTNYELKPVGNIPEVSSHDNTDDMSHSYMNTTEVRNLTPEPIPNCGDT